MITKLLYGSRRGSSREASDREVGREPVRVVAEHDVQRPVRVRGDAAGPRRAARQILGAGERLQRDRIEALDPGDRVRSGRVAQEEDLVRLAEHDHRRGDRVAGLNFDVFTVEGPGRRR